MLGSLILCLAAAGCSNQIGGPGGESESGNKTPNAETAENNGKNGNNGDNGNGGEGDPVETESPTEEEVIKAPVEAAAPKSLEEIKKSVAFDEVKAPKLKEIGTFAKPGEGGFLGDYLSDDEDRFQLRSHSEKVLGYYDYLGRELFGGQVESVSKLEHCPYYVYTLKTEGDEQYVGLMDAQGNVIISPEEKAGAITEVNEDGRYIIVYNLKEETDQEDMAIHHGLKWVDNTLKVVYYEGNATVYDLQERRYIRNAYCDRTPAFGIYNDEVIVNGRAFDEVTGQTTYIKADDTVHHLEGNYQFAGDKLLLRTNYQPFSIEAFDHDANLLFTTTYEVEEIPNSSELYLIHNRDTDLYGVIHYSGLVVIEPKYKTLRYLAGEFFSFTNPDEKGVGIVNLDGEEIFPNTYYNVAYSGIPGLFVASKEEHPNGKKDIIDATGKIVSEDCVCRKESAFIHHFLPNQNYLYNYDQENGICEFYVVDDLDKTLSFKGSYDYYGDFIVHDLNDSVLYSLVTGEKLAEGFDRSFCAYGHIYTQKDDVVTVYEIEK